MSCPAPRIVIAWSMQCCLYASSCSDPALLDQLDHPPRIEIDAETNAAAMLRQMLDCQPQPPRPRRAQHQPVRAVRKILLRQRVAEERVVGPKILDRHAALRHARGAARLEHVDRLVGERLRHPPPHRPAAEPLVLERRELLQIVVRAYLGERIELQLLLEIEPERAAGRVVKMPGDRLDHVGIERFACSADGIGGGSRRHRQLPTRRDTGDRGRRQL